MYFHKKIIAVLGLTAGLVSCNQAMVGGSLNSPFKGISTATVLSPTTVQLSWPRVSSCNTYEIHLFSSGSSEASTLGTSSISPFTVRAPTLQADQAYTFSIACVQNNKTVGTDITKSVSTWPRFGGGLTATLNTSGLKPAIELSWNYPNTGSMFEIYAVKSNVPGDLSSWLLDQSGENGKPVGLTPICTVFNANKVTIGSGPNDCSSASLETGMVYNFKVVAVYPSREYSVDYANSGTSILVPASFTPPDCKLTAAGLGPDALHSYLYLRCTTAGVLAGDCPGSQVKAQVFQAINGSRTAISESKDVTTGLIPVEARLDATKPNDRQLESVEVEYSCIGAGPTLKSVVRYDAVGSDPAKPTLKYTNSYVDKASGDAAGVAPGYFGGNPSNASIDTGRMAVGDFDCDGKPDLAVGLPYVSYTKAPYFSQSASSGLVKVYYDYTNGSLGDTAVQYLSFRDLAQDAKFGWSLSSGNINRDIHKDTSANTYYSCDDLIVGAPGINSAFIYYGNPQRFQQPLDAANLPFNTSTCSGNIDSSSCSVVRLGPNDTSVLGVTETDNRVAFGSAVSYVGDYNADGYGDVVIGAPSANWDGYAVGGKGDVVVPGGRSAVTMMGVGAIYVFFGGKNGLKTVDVGATGNGTLSSVPYVKAYPPIPQAGMAFGSSISGGGDIDSKPPVPVIVDSANHIILAEGRDFIVGAPGFKYNDNSQLGTARTTSADWDLRSADSVDPVVKNTTGNSGDKYPLSNTITDKVTPPLNGAWAGALWTDGAQIPMPSGPLASSTGIAFAYLGRSSHISYQVILRNGTTGTVKKRVINGRFNNTTNDELYNPNDGWLNEGLKNYQVGSTYMKLPAALTYDYRLNPKESFYNCGLRGSPAPFGGKVYHNSCLAGRNNFRVIYPELKSGDTAIQGFGQKVALIGSKEVNAMALFFAISDRYHYNFTQSSETLSTHKQGNAHFKILGQNSWELAVNGINNPAAVTPAQYCSDLSTSCNWGAADSTAFHLGRSPLSESYSSWKDGGDGGTTVSTSSVVLAGDLNRDGYADVVVSSGSDVWTYYGNYAADFSYSDSLNDGSGAGSYRYTTAAACRVTRDAAVDFGVGAPPSLSTQKTPFRTYSITYATAKDQATNSVQFNKVTAEFPYYPIQDGSSSSPIGFRYIGDDSASTDLLTFLRYVSVNRPSPTPTYKEGIGACVPQRKFISIQSISIADVNGDGAGDVFMGVSSANSNQGMGVLALSGGNGVSGLSTDVPFNDGTTTDTNGASPSRAGQSVFASDWQTLTGVLTENERRDLLLGAPGQKVYSDISGNSVCLNAVGQNPVPGAGIIHHYSATNTATMSTVRSPSSQNTCFYDISNAPYNLGMETSQIIGDINGDGYDDIWSPLKRYERDGSEYYDGVLFFGSPYGAVTTTFCLQKINFIYQDAEQTSQISSSSCEAAVVAGKAYMGGSQIFLPQLVRKPYTVSAAWAKSAHRAGDVNNDGKDDIFFSDSSGFDLYFGSSYGLVNSSEPTSQLATSLAPQLISTTIAGASVTLNSQQLVPYYAAGSSLAVVSYPYQNAIAVGDFNGDGYADIAFTVNSVSPTPGTNVATPVGTPWNCDRPNDTSEACYVKGTYPLVVADPGPPQAESSVVVLYGGSSGYQVPNGITFPTGEICSDFYTNCTQASTGTAKSAFGSLNINTMTGAVTIDTSKTACDSNGNCTGVSWLRNPVFYNQQGSYALLNNKFGTSLAVADTNNDGIDDLVIGAPGFQHGHVDQNISAGYYSDFSSGTLAEVGATAPHVDKTGKGSAFIFYGSKNFGVVAPVAKEFLGNKSLGLNNSGTASVTFRIYPHWSGATVTTAPALDVAAGAYDESHRQFGANATSGDFNGDGIDDVAIVSGRGQVYVYYGPICGADNGYNSNFDTLHYAGTYLGNPNYGMFNNKNKPTTIHSSHSDKCVQVDLSSGTASPASAAPVAKTLLPQYITVPSSTAIMGMGSTLLSLRSGGDVNGNESVAKSDLVIGAPFAIDGNVMTSSYTGLGYVFFGSMEGIYVSIPNYNSSVIEDTNATSTARFYSTPLTLQPYKPDGSIVGFFYKPSSVGDINGDGRMDIMMPTLNVNETNDPNRKALGAGGFSLFY